MKLLNNGDRAEVIDCYAMVPTGIANRITGASTLNM
jgi:hypothetical protein